MPETAAVDGPPVGKSATTVSASVLAVHLDCSRTYIGKLEAEGVIQRQTDGFPLDQSRVAYLRYLRRERQQSPPTQADADYVKVKTEMLQTRLMEKRRELKAMQDGDVRAANTIVAMVLKLNPPKPADEADEEVTESDRAIIEDYLNRHTRSKPE